MTDVLWLLLRGAVQVGPVVAVTVFVSREKWLYAAVTSCGLSTVWYLNVGVASHLVGWPWALCYGAGAGLGTAVGQAVARRIAR